MSDGIQAGRVTAHDFIIGRIRRGKRGEENPFFIASAKTKFTIPKTFYIYVKPPSCCLPFCRCCWRFASPPSARTLSSCTAAPRSLRRTLCIPVLRRRTSSWRTCPCRKTFLIHALDIRSHVRSSPTSSRLRSSG